MAQTWRSAQATRKHASQNAILLEVSDVLIKTPSSLRKMVDQIHETAVERCKEGSLGTWGLWKFYLAALAERLKAGDLQVLSVPAALSDTVLCGELHRYSVHRGHSCRNEARMLAGLGTVLLGRANASCAMLYDCWKQSPDRYNQVSRCT